jgi:beta-lactamase class A
VRKIVFGVLILILLVLGAGFYLVKFAKPVEITYKFLADTQEKVTADPKIDEVVKQVNIITGTVSGEYAFWVYRFADKKSYGWGEDKKMPMASMIKVPIMAAAIKAIDDQKLSLDGKYQVLPVDIRDGSSYEEGDVLTIENMLEETGRRSDNITPVMLVRIVGEKNVQRIVSLLGLDNNVWESKEATPAEVGEMWKKLIDSDILSADSRELLWGYLRDSIYEDRIVLGLEGLSGLKVTHKVGTDIGVWTDSGFVEDAEGNKLFVVVIMNKDTDRAEATVVVPEIAKTIGDYEFKKAGGGL